MRNVQPFAWHHQRVSRALELNIRMKSRQRLVRETPQPLVVRDAPNALWLMDSMHHPRSYGRRVRLAQTLFLSQHRYTAGAHYMHNTVFTAIPNTTNNFHHVNTA